MLWLSRGLSKVFSTLCVWNSRARAASPATIGSRPAPSSSHRKSSASATDGTTPWNWCVFR